MPIGTANSFVLYVVLHLLVTLTWSW